MQLTKDQDAMRVKPVYQRHSLTSRIRCNGKTQVLCIGMATIDHVLFSDRVPTTHDEIALIQSDIQCAGGKGLVTAACLAALGVDVACLSLVGSEESADVLKDLIPPSLGRVHLWPWLKRTSRTWICVSGNEHVVTYVSSGVPDIPTAVQISQELEPLIIGSRMIYLTAEHPSLIKAAFRLAKLHQKPVVTNLCNAILVPQDFFPKSLIQQLAMHSEVLLLNEGESDSVLRRLDLPAWSDVPPGSLREIVVTKAAQGGSVSNSPFVRWSHFTAKFTEGIVSPVGAGDTFNGAYVKARLLDDMAPALACTAAAEVAAIKLTLPTSLIDFDL